MNCSLFCFLILICPIIIFNLEKSLYFQQRRYSYILIQMKNYSAMLLSYAFIYLFCFKYQNVTFISLLFIFYFLFFFIYFYQLEANYFTTFQWVLSDIDMNQPWSYMYSPSRSPLPHPFPPNSSGSSQCTRPEHLSYASHLGW